MCECLFGMLFQLKLCCLCLPYNKYSLVLNACFRLSLVRLLTLLAALLAALLPIHGLEIACVDASYAFLV